MASKDVGTCTTRTPRMLCVCEDMLHFRRCTSYAQRGSDKADEVSDHSTAKGDDDGVPCASMGEKKVFDLGFSFACLGRLARRDDMREKAWTGGS